MALWARSRDFFFRGRFKEFGAKRGERATPAPPLWIRASRCLTSLSHRVRDPCYYGCVHQGISIDHGPSYTLQVSIMLAKTIISYFQPF